MSTESLLGTISVLTRSRVLQLPNRVPKAGCSLAEKYPHLLEMWSTQNSVDPYKIFPRSNTKYLWICHKGHKEWLSSPSNIVGGRGCPECAELNRAISRSTPPLEKSLAYLYPDLTKEWSSKNTKTPSEVYGSSGKNYWWICPIHGEYRSSCSNRVIGQGCMDCGRDRTRQALFIPKPNCSLGDLHPELVPLWSSKNDKSPFDYKPKSNVKVWWVCKEHGEYEQLIFSGAKCPTCGRDRVNKGRSIPPLSKSLAYLYPDLVKEWSKNNKKKPEEVYAGSGYRAKWVCKKGHEWVTSCDKRTRKDMPTGCPRCACVGMSNIERNLHDLLIPYGADKSENISIGHWKVDIYFPNTKTIVEYDGSRFHSFSKAQEKDTRKSQDLLSKDYTVIRIREISDRFILEPLNINHPNYHEIFYENGYHKKYSSDPTEELVEEVIKCLT